MDQTKHNTPSKLSTTYFSPNEWQIRSAIRGEDRYVPRRRVSALRWLLAAIALICLAYAGTYFVLVRVLG